MPIELPQTIKEYIEHSRRQLMAFEPDGPHDRSIQVIIQGVCHTMDLLNESVMDLQKDTRRLANEIGAERIRKEPPTGLKLENPP
jgi:hypothetical protein